MRSTPRSPRAAQAVYAQQCLSCHGDHRFKDGVKSGDRVGQVEDIDRIQTDRHRLDSYTTTFALNQYALFPDSRVSLHALPQDARLRQPAARRHLAARPLPAQRLGADAARSARTRRPARPAAFYRGYDVFDQARVGFVSNVAEAGGRRFTRYDTSVPGNGNMGHDYGIALPDADKDAIVEYLKTF